MQWLRLSPRSPDDSYRYPMSINQWRRVQILLRIREHAWSWFLEHGELKGYHHVPSHFPDELSFPYAPFLSLRSFSIHLSIQFQFKISRFCTSFILTSYIVGDAYRRLFCLSLMLYLARSNHHEHRQIRTQNNIVGCFQMIWWLKCLFSHGYNHHLFRSHRRSHHTPPPINVFIINHLSLLEESSLFNSGRCDVTPPLRFDCSGIGSLDLTFDLSEMTYFSNRWPAAVTCRIGVAWLITGHSHGEVERKKGRLLQEGLHLNENHLLCSSLSSSSLLLLWMWSYVFVYISSCSIRF